MCSTVVALASGSPEPSQLTKNPAISVCMASTSQAGCPSTILQPASGTAYVQEVPEANLLHVLLTVTQHGECRGLEVHMHTPFDQDLFARLASVCGGMLDPKRAPALHEQALA